MSSFMQRVMRKSRVEGKGLPGAAGMSRLRLLRPGCRVLVFYDGVDTVWHERLLLWCVSRDLQTWLVCSPDKQVWAEMLQGRVDASHVICLPDDGRRPYLTQPIYPFTVPVDDDELRRLLRESYTEGVSDGRDVFLFHPHEVVTWDGHRASFQNFGIADLITAPVVHLDQLVLPIAPAPGVAGFAPGQVVHVGDLGGAVAAGALLPAFQPAPDVLVDGVKVTPAELAADAAAAFGSALDYGWCRSPSVVLLLETLSLCASRMWCRATGRSCSWMSMACRRLWLLRLCPWVWPRRTT